MSYNVSISKKDKTTTLILCLFLGYLGVHLFYVGKNKLGVVYLLTLGLFGFGWFIDFLLIVTNSFKDSTGAVISSMPQTSNTTINNTKDVPTDTSNINETKKETENKITEKVEDKNLVKVIEQNGNVIKLDYKTYTKRGTCLYSEGGTKYHTYVGCYRTWKPKYQKNFNGWEMISTKEASKRGLTKCNFCKKRDNGEGIYLEYESKKILKKFTITHRDEFADISDYHEGDEVIADYDFSKDKYILDVNGDEIGYASNTISEFISELDNYKMFVLDLDENDNGKVKFKIGIYEDNN